MKTAFQFFLVLLGLVVWMNHAAAKEDAAEKAPLAYTVKVEGVISPATYDLIKRHLEQAAKDEAAVVVLQLHTPGGLYESMQQIIKDILESPVPVVTYVSPGGAHAASAGTYILYASHIAAMAPGTNIGAATPVQMSDPNSGKDKSDPSMPQKNAAPKSTMEQKMISDAAAYIRGLAELRGRNAEWAERAVREAESLTSSEALSKKVIDFIADDTKSLLDKIDGRTVKMAAGKTVKLATKGARIETYTPDWRHDLLEIITHPNVAFLLMTLGTYGLIYEFSNPGAILPGVVGAICLVLGLFAMNILPINMTGLTLLFLGMGLMAAEAFTPTFGVLGIGGAVSFAVGATMLIDSQMPGFGIDWWVIAGVTLLSVGFLSVLMAMAVRAQRKPTTTGIEELTSAIGEILAWSGGEGEVHVTGETWKAKGSTTFILKPGDKVRILEVEGLCLTVEPYKQQGES